MIMNLASQHKNICTCYKHDSDDEEQPHVGDLVNTSDW